MKTQKITKEKIIESVTKMVVDKESVRSYLKGKTSIETLNRKGIKFAKPL